jgi:hypothetical protein
VHIVLPPVHVIEALVHVVKSLAHLFLGAFDSPYAAFYAVESGFHSGNSILCGHHPLVLA